MIIDILATEFPVSELISRSGRYLRGHVFLGFIVIIRCIWDDIGVLPSAISIRKSSSFLAHLELTCTSADRCIDVHSRLVVMALSTVNLP